VIKDNFRNLGLGTLMVCKVERLSLERGFERLTLTVHPDNGPAVSLCHKLGYQPFKYFHEIMGGKEIPVVCMLKKLL
jgi:ribosomal protein S18 acetylase RimI-like enzyme